MPRMEDGIDMAVQLLVVGLLVAYLLPEAIDAIVNVSTSSWGSAEAGLWDLLPIFIVIGAVLYIIGMAINAYK